MTKANTSYDLGKGVIVSKTPKSHKSVKIYDDWFCDIFSIRFTSAG